MESKKIAVITVCYENVEGVRQTFDSVLKQTSSDFEYIVVDGGSTDGTVDLIKSYEKTFSTHGISFKWISEPDQGIYDAMNKGIMSAEGEYSIFMNSGDTFYSDDVLEKMHGTLTKDEDMFDIYYGKTFCRGNDDKESFVMPFYVIEGRKYITKMPTKHQGFFIKTSLLKLRPYDTSFRIIADFEWIMHAFYGGNSFKNLGWIVCSFDTSGVSSTHLTEKYREASRARKRYGCADPFPVYLVKVCVWFVFEKTGLCKQLW